MNIQQCRIICFSPTGGTAKIAAAIARGTELSVVVSDLTLPSHEEEPTPTLRENEFVILAAPVYYGRVAKTAIERMASLQGAGNPALVLVTYGNRHYDDALLELYTLAETAGFMPVAAAAFVAEHSFCTAEFPFATGRPDGADLSAAEDFGRRLVLRLRGGAAKLPGVPGNVPYKPYPHMHRAPLCTEACSLCGTCMSLCPTNAIYMEEGRLRTDEQRCIVCQACVKGCPAGARVDTASGASETRERLSTLIKERREPEIF